MKKIKLKINTPKRGYIKKFTLNNHKGANKIGIKKSYTPKIKSSR